jgi:hypothetical protein
MGVGSPPLTPFPPWVCQDEETDSPATTGRLGTGIADSTARKVLGMAVHEAVLGVECLVLVLVVGVVVGMTVCERAENTEEFWSW